MVPKLPSIDPVNNLSPVKFVTALGTVKLLGLPLRKGLEFMGRNFKSNLSNLIISFEIIFFEEFCSSLRFNPKAILKPRSPLTTVGALAPLYDDRQRSNFKS